ncbi:MAG: PD-(D/E)XK nuclease family transposase [Eubacteriales bacterium]|nr:PD-(D/E)XK nuclease family transposase [Eubacteriales bacterium]
MTESTANTNDKILRKLAAMRMFDDAFMSAVFDGRNEETALLLNIILGRSDIKVLSVKTQVYITNIYGREVKLDILAEDESGKAYNIEIQRELAGASPQRARFHAALVDGRLLKKGQNFDDLPDRYTIFITEEDKYQKGLPAYHAQYTLQELENEPLGDGSFLIYVNGQYRNTDTPIGRLMHDFACNKSEDLLTPLLRERVHYLKNTKGGREEMSSMVEELITEEKIEMAKQAILRGKYSLEDIAGILDLPLAFVQELAKQSNIRY